MIGSICTDGASIMMGNCSGFAAMLKKGDTRVKNNSLFGSKTGSCLRNTTSMSEGCPYNSCMKIVNYVRGRALNHRLFLSFSQDVN